MAWFTLIVSGLMESVWATALSRSNGLTQPLPTVVFFAGLALSMLGLAHATKTLPIGVAYAVWTAIGAAVTALYGMATGAESASVLKILFIAGIVGCVIGLKIASDAA